MSQVKHSPMMRYGFAVLAVAVALLLTLLILPLSARTPFALFYIAVMLSAVYGGRGAGLLATALSVLTTAYFILPPKYSLKVGFEGVFMLAVFIFVALVISSLTEKVVGAEKSARLSGTQLSTTLMSIGDAVIATDAEGRIALMNAVAQTLTGWTLDEALGQRLEDVFRIINEQTREAVESPVAKVLREGTVVGLANHTLLLARDGKEIPIDDSGAPIRDEEGNITGVVLVFRDISEMKEADEKIRFHAHLLNEVEQAVVATDMEGRITYWNQFAEKLYGWQAVEVIGRNVLEVTPSDASREQAEEILTHLRRGESWSGDFQAQRRDGSVFPARVTDSPVYDADGKQIGIVGSSEDISERKRGEEARRLLAAIIQSSDDAILSKTLEGKVTSWNAGAQKMYGYTAEEAVGQHISFIIPPELEGQLKEILERIQLGERIEHLETLRVRKDGTRINVSVRISPVNDATGQVVGASSIARDITERMKTEQALRESEEHHRIVAETASDAIITIDERSEIIFVNRAAEGIFGYTVEEMQGQSLTLLMPDYLRHVHSAGFHRYLETGRKHISWQGVELPGLHKDGHEIPLELSFSEFIRGGERFFTGIARDVTERKLVEEKQAEVLAREQAARTQAELANRTKDEFLATLSHELRTPLTAMLGWTWMLRSTELDRQTRAQALESIERNVRAQAQLIEDLLDVSRIITGKLRLEVRPAELIPVIESALDTVRPAAEAKEIRLQVELDPTASHVLCDPARIQQVAWNLLSNAIKFTPKNGRVRVRLERVESHVEISVKDTGPGINPEFLPYVFDRFRQADSSTTRMHGGLGIGLAIVRHLVELHGGTARVESEGDGHGSTFTVALPLLAVSTNTVGEATEHALPDEKQATLENSLSLEGLRVLVVDDEPDARELLVVALGQSGARVNAVASAGEALELVAARETDVLVSDIGMPFEDGYMLIRKVRELEREHGAPEMPAVALTAYASETARAQALEAGFQAHLAKPIEPSVLIETISTLMKQKELNVKVEN
ncbi:MAG: PAS domain S-box protein [Pyrinomonadaceae bacterium]|nr:PAS domain S-box protein [Pyrinomonadaceae bacterium]